MGFRKPRKAIGLDIGTHAVKAVLMSRSMGKLRVEQACHAAVDRNQLNADPVMAQSMAVREVMDQMPKAQSLVVASLTGQTVVVRYLRLTDVAREQVASTIMREAANNIPYDLNEVFMDWDILEEYQEEERRVAKVIIVAAMQEVVDMRLQILRNAEVECGVIGVDSLALADAAEACGLFTPEETVAMIDIGLTSSSVQFIKGGVSNFIRDVNWGVRELVQTIAKTQRCTYEQAVDILENYRKEVHVPEALDANLEKTQDRADGSVTVLPTPEEKISSPLDPFDDEEDFGLPSPAAEYNRADIPMAMEPQREVQLEEVVAGPLNRFATELRRSFDYYEHQLYERPVDRILLCGGPAEFPPLVQALEEELGFGVIEVVSPTSGSIVMPDKRAVMPLLAHPAQFTVALGLAARGMADL